MSKRARHDSLSAELLMSSDGSSDAESAHPQANVPCPVSDPMMELLKSMQATMSTGFQKIGDRMGKVETDMKKIKSDKSKNMNDEDPANRKNTEMVVAAAKPVEVIAEKAASHREPKRPKTDDKRGRQLFTETELNTRNGTSPHTGKDRKKPDMEKSAGGKKCEFSGVTYKKIDRTINAKKNCIDISDGSEDSYIAKEKRLVPIPDKPSITCDEIMECAASATVIPTTNNVSIKITPVRLEDWTSVKASENRKDGVHTGAGYRRMTTSKFDSRGDHHDETVTLLKRKRKISTDSDDCFADLLGSVVEIPPTPVQSSKALVKLTDKGAMNEQAMDAAKAATAAAVSAKTSTSSKPKLLTNELRTKTNPTKPPSGGPKVVAAPPIVRGKPLSGPTSVACASENGHEDSAATNPRDKTRRTKFYPLESSYNKGKEVSMEGELKKEKGEMVPYINLILTTNGEVGTRPSKFTMRATTMAKMMRGRRFNEVMLALRQLDPGNRNCELWV